MIIDGKALSDKIREEIKIEVSKIKENGKTPTLAVIIVGEDAASKIYVKNKEKACESVGMKSMTYHLPENSTESDVIELIEALNESDNVDGLLVQVPLPKHLDEAKILSKISNDKDVDGFLRESVGKLYLNEDGFAPCTPSGIIELIKSTGETIVGKHAVVIGRSNIVGKPVSLLLLRENATVTICHSKTVNIGQLTKQADILVVAIGKKEFVTGDMVKDGAIVIDVGMNRVDGKLYGDVNFDEVSKKASYITPVPGGVGPMTITMLLKNTLKARKMKELNGR
ncbi:MAG: bifunctional methylenetetrahydrofolate dehydrogenase/methenyltetrahydrofolate cyclohydrolase FolD [Clostridia bacterium]